MFFTFVAVDCSLFMDLLCPRFSCGSPAKWSSSRSDPLRRQGYQAAMRFMSPLYIVRYSDDSVVRCWCGFKSSPELQSAKATSYVFFTVKVPEKVLSQNDLKTISFCKSNVQSKLLHTKHWFQRPSLLAKLKLSMNLLREHFPKRSPPHCFSGSTLSFTMTRTCSSKDPAQTSFSKYARAAKGTVYDALYPFACPASVTVVLDSGPVPLYSPTAEKMAVMSLSWLKSAYSALRSGKVAGLSSRVWFVEV